MKQFNIQTIIDLIMNISWGYALSVVFGAFVSAIIVHNLTKKRELLRLKFEVQIKTAEQLIESIKIFSDLSASMFFQNITSFSIYNSVLQQNQKVEDENNDNDWINEFRDNQIRKAKDSIYKCMDSYMVLWSNYASKFFSIISILESKKVILNKFVGFKELLLVEFDKLSEIHNSIMHLYQFEIAQSIIYSEPIEDECLKTFGEYENMFMEKRVEIGAIILDLNIGIQNEFFSKLFNYRVPLRQPKDKSSPVYEAGYVYKETENQKEHC